MVKGFNVDDFLASPLGSIGYKTGMGLLGDVFSSRTRRKQLRNLQDDAERDLRDAYVAIGQDLQSSYSTSGLEPTYGLAISDAYQRGLQKTRESFARERKSSKSWLGSIFFK